MSLHSFFKNLGPGPLIAAAFIGPGTVTVCTLAGVNFGYSLLWALVLSIVATVILQEITGRIGLVTGQDLSQLIRKEGGNAVFRYFSMVLVLLAIGLGNAAYESGNISGTNLGMQVFWESPVFRYGNLELHLGNLILGLLAFGALLLGSYSKLERILIGLVVCMSMAFVVTALLTRPDWSRFLDGFIPSVDSGQFTTIVALIGTTVVPYNLFLYASLAKNRWTGAKDIPWMRRDIAISILMGGLVSMAILSVGAASESGTISNALDVSKGLEGVFGSFAKYLMGFGLMAAGLTSSITAPLAAGLVICGVLGKSQDIRSTPMRMAMGSIVGLGIIFSSFGIKPIQLITLAQLANGVLLPLVSGWIIWIASSAGIMGTYRNKARHSLLAVLIWLITLALGLRSILAVLGST